MTKKTRNWLVALLSIPAIAILAVVGLLLFLELQPLPSIQPLPNPNGYSDLVKAGNMVSNDFEDYDQLSSEKLRELTNKDAEAIQIARMGLQQKCRTTLVYSAISSAYLDQLAAMKHLAFAFVAEGRLAGMENRPGDAAKSYSDVIRLGNESPRGGIIIDQLVGIAIKAIGTSHLQKLVDQLDAKTCHETAATLETLDAQGQTWNEVMQQEKAWARRTYPGVKYQFAALMMHNTLKKAYQSAEQKFDRQQGKMHQLIIDLAARAYELDKGHRPASLADLVPDYLKAIPQDPLTGKNMVYSP